MAAAAVMAMSLFIIPSFTAAAMSLSWFAGWPSEDEQQLSDPFIGLAATFPVSQESGREPD
jgi:hypothetical protein